MKIILLILLCCVSIAAQTKDATQKNDARKNYGTLVSESYEIRPSVRLTVDYSKEGQICRMNFQPYYLTDLPEVTYESLEKIVDEVIPMNERGKLIGNGFLSGASVYGTMKVYDKLTIDKVTATQRREHDPYINVVWKDKICINYPVFKSTVPKSDVPKQ